MSSRKDFVFTYSVKCYLDSMDIAILVLSIITIAFFGENYLLRRKTKDIQEAEDINEVEKTLTKIAADRLKIKNDVDRMSLEQLVDRKRDGDGDNT